MNQEIARIVLGAEKLDDSGKNFRCKFIVLLSSILLFVIPVILLTYGMLMLPGTSNIAIYDKIISVELSTKEANTVECIYNFHIKYLKEGYQGYEYDTSHISIISDNPDNKSFSCSNEISLPVYYPRSGYGFLTNLTECDNTTCYIDSTIISNSQIVFGIDSKTYYKNYCRHRENDLIRSMLLIIFGFISMMISFAIYLYSISKLF